VPWLLAECACRSAEEGENDSLTSRSEQIGLQKIDDFATPTINYGLHHEKTETLCLIQLNRRRQREFLTVDHNFDESRPGWLSAWGQEGVDFPGAFAFSPSTPAASAIFAKSGLRRSVAKSSMPAAFISSSTKARALLLKTISFTGKSSCRSDSNKPPMHHGSDPVHNPTWCALQIESLRVV